jgi:hypothetical protein
LTRVHSLHENLDDLKITTHKSSFNV